MLHRKAEIDRACREGNIDLLKDSLGDDIQSDVINQSNEEGLAPIHLALLYNDYPATKYLLNLLFRNGADVNGVDKRSGDSLLQLCFRFKSPNVSKLLIPFLLNKGCDYHLKNYAGKTALDVAKENGYSDLETLVHGDSSKNTVAEPIVYSGVVETKQQPTKSTKPSLIDPILLNDVIQVQKLLEDGSDPNDDENSKYFPVHYAVSKGQPDPVVILELLENHGADMGSKTEENDTVLTLAIKKIELEPQCLKVVEYLKGCGVSTTEKDNDGNDAKTLAMMRHFDSVVEALGSVHQFEGPYHPIHNICQKKNMAQQKKIELLENPYFKNKVPVDLRTKPENETCLLIACRNSEVQLVKYLLSKEAQVRMTNKKGETPLSITRDVTRNATIEQMLIEADNRQNVKEIDEVKLETLRKEPEPKREPEPIADVIEKADKKRCQLL